MLNSDGQNNPSAKKRPCIESSVKTSMLVIRKLDSINCTLGAPGDNVVTPIIKSPCLLKRGNSEYISQCEVDALTDQHSPPKRSREDVSPSPHSEDLVAVLMTPELQGDSQKILGLPCEANSKEITVLVPKCQSQTIELSLSSIQKDPVIKLEANSKLLVQERPTFQQNQSSNEHSLCIQKYSGNDAHGNSTNELQLAANANSSGNDMESDAVNEPPLTANAWEMSAQSQLTKTKELIYSMEPSVHQWQVHDLNDHVWIFSFFNGSLELRIILDTRADGVDELENKALLDISMDTTCLELSSTMKLAIDSIKGKFPRVKLTSLCKYIQQVPSLLDVISSQVKEASILLKDIAFCKDAYDLQVKDNWVSFDIPSYELRAWFIVKIDLSEWEDISPSSVHVRTMLGKVNEDYLKEMIKSVKRPHFLRNYVVDVHEYIKTLELYAVQQ